MLLAIKPFTFSNSEKQNGDKKEGFVAESPEPCSFLSSEVGKLMLAIALIFPFLKLVKFSSVATLICIYIKGGKVDAGDRLALLLLLPLLAMGVGAMDCSRCCNRWTHLQSE